LQRMAQTGNGRWRLAERFRSSFIVGSCSSGSGGSFSAGCIVG
jgi:hypothetical protein